MNELYLSIWERSLYFIFQRKILIIAAAIILADKCIYLLITSTPMKKKIYKVESKVVNVEKECSKAGKKDVNILPATSASQLSSIYPYLFFPLQPLTQTQGYSNDSRDFIRSERRKRMKFPFFLRIDSNSRILNESLLEYVKGQKIEEKVI